MLLAHGGLQASVLKEVEEKAAKRKERFEAPKVIDPEEAERMAKRAARFGSGS